jgi:hypothetical protein
MTCQHGFDEANCPICRMSDHTKPKKFIQKEKVTKVHPLNQHGQFLKQYFKQKEEELKELQNEKKSQDNHKSVELRSKASFSPTPSLNKLPSFKNKMFFKRLNEIKPNSLSKFNLSQRVSLESSEWKFGEDSEEPLTSDFEKNKEKDKL